MTTDDLYLSERRSRTGCLLLVFLLVLIAAGAAWWLWLRPHPGPAAPQPTAAAAEATAMDSGLAALAEARQLKAQDKMLEARDKALGILDASSNAIARTGAEQLLGEVNVVLVTTPRAMPEKTDYAVQPGDSLALLAKKFNTTVDLIQRGNNLQGSVIRAGDRLRIFSGKYEIRVSKTKNDLVLLVNDRFFKRYAVGTGQYGKTPVGSFLIKDKIPNPPWWRSDGKQIPFGDTNNVLGTRWMGLKYADDTPLAGYGIHGTWEPDTIGKQASAGCIRLLNSDVEELFALVPEGTPVTISD